MPKSNKSQVLNKPYSALSDKGRDEANLVLSYILSPTFLVNVLISITVVTEKAGSNKARRHVIMSIQEKLKSVKIMNPH